MGMDMQSRREYSRVIRERYWKAHSKTEKSLILSEYCSNTGQNRKYAIRKLGAAEKPQKKARKKRQAFYDSPVVAALAKVWAIFDYPCGQRLKPMIVRETDRLRFFGELLITDEVASKLKTISSAQIDRKLRREKEILHLSRSKGRKPGSMLTQQVAVRLTNWDTAKVGYVEADLVMHCGASTLGSHVCTVSATEVSSGWWEGEPIWGKDQLSTFEALKGMRSRMPFQWLGLDTDNGSEFMSEVLFKYCHKEKLEFTRSRPSHKNDNAYIEQKNWTHVRKVLGHLRYATPKELQIIRELFHNELRLYKNFFQPVMKLEVKERSGGKIVRRYGVPRTPHEYLIESGQIAAEVQQQLKDTYAFLNPAELKRRIDAKLEALYRTYEEKNRGTQADTQKRVVPSTVTFSVMQ